MKKQSTESIDEEGKEIIDLSNVSFSPVSPQIYSSSNEDHNVDVQSSVSSLSSLLTSSCNVAEDNEQSHDEYLNNPTINQNADVGETIIEEDCDIKAENKIPNFHTEKSEDTLTSMKSTALSATAIVLSTFIPINLWSPYVIDNITQIGKKLYLESFLSLSKNSNIGLKERFLKPFELIKTIEIAAQCMATFEIVQETCGENILQIICGEQYLSFSKIILNICCNQKAAILNINRRSVAILSRFEKYYLFDPEGRNKNGITCFPRLNIFTNIPTLINWITDNYYISPELTNPDMNNSKCFEEKFLFTFLTAKSSSENGEGIDLNKKNYTSTFSSSTDENLSNKPSNDSIKDPKTDFEDICEEDANNDINEYLSDSIENVNDYKSNLEFMFSSCTVADHENINDNQKSSTETHDVENMRMNAYAISTIKVTSFNVNGKENQMSDCLLNQTFDIFASFMTNKTSESMKHLSHQDPPP
ncbi:hypothetical protein KQX54_008108 [Cotesia glomerata]|uniref:Uncharacterized protein n=1 Tax=Cotesia glomerata TaxID=32391 RepID=A0AAV7IY75_COTGL|nr:hypothetical protein KQX54_008108 [Cotesia glomerata]